MFGLRALFDFFQGKKKRLQFMPMVLSLNFPACLCKNRWCQNPTGSFRHHQRPNTEDRQGQVHRRSWQDSGSVSKQEISQIQGVYVNRTIGKTWEAYVYRKNRQDSKGVNYKEKHARFRRRKFIYYKLSDCLCVCG